MADVIANAPYQIFNQVVEPEIELVVEHFFSGFPFF